MTERPRGSLIAIGDNCLDVYLEDDLVTVGGNALNVAVRWGRDGRPARYLGAVGDDAAAEIVLSALAAAGLDPADTERRHGDTAFTLLARDGGDRHFLLEVFGVGQDFVPSPATYGEIAAADWVHLGTNANVALVRRLVADRVAFSVDISTAHDALPLGGVPLVFASGPDDPRAPAEPVLRHLLRAGARQAVLTCGGLGAYFSDGTSVLHAPALPVEIVDTCGAGDSFIATFIAASRCDGASPEQALRAACAAAAETCTHLGGFPQQARPVPEAQRNKYERLALRAKGR